MLKKIKYSMFVGTLLLMGCTPSHNIVFESDPPSAVLYCEGERLGLMPSDIDYDISEEQQKQGFFTLRECEAKWVSGARSRVENLRVQIEDDPFSSSRYFFKRPNYPNYEEDIAFAQEQEFMKQRMQDLEYERSIDEDYDHDYHHHHHSGGRDIARMHKN